MRKRMMSVLAGLTTAGFIALATPASANPATLYSPDPLDGWGQDGTAYAVTISRTNSIVYAGGSFLNAARYQQRQPRQNLMAVAETTGNLIPPCIGTVPCFGPGPNGAWTNGTVRAMATDGVSLYIGGDFTQVNGQARTRIARLDLSGTLLPLNVSAPKAVRDMLVVGSGSNATLYVVGDFGTVTGSNGLMTRKRAAAFNVSTGAVLPFNPNLSGKANAVAIAPNGGTVYLGGNFLTVGGQTRRYLAAVNPGTGAPTSAVFDQAGDVILDISVSDDGSRVFGAGGGGFNSAAAWNATGGRPVWTVRANGDVQAVRYSNGNLYFGFHDGYNGNTRLRLLAADAGTGTVEQAFQPISGGTPGPVALDADGSYLVVGGRFPRMGAIRVKGLSIHP
jgi:hypothetical protein